MRCWIEMRFVQHPNLPASPVRHLLIGRKYADFVTNLLEIRGILPIFVPDNVNVDQRMSGHADLSVLHLGGNRVLYADFLKENRFLRQLSAIGAEPIPAEIEQNPAYPQDCGLNVCILGNKLICREMPAKAIADNILTIRETLLVRQGYARCSVCVADERSALTADPGIAQALERHGIDVLLVRPDLAVLPGYDCGFIGGASFKTGLDELAFTGTIRDSMERGRIEDFLLERNIKPVYLTADKPLDIGGAIPLTEESE